MRCAETYGIAGTTQGGNAGAGGRAGETGPGRVPGGLNAFLRCRRERATHRAATGRRAVRTTGT